MPCIFCKSVLHDYRACPLAYQAKKRPFKQHFTGSAPSVFIGRHGYPHVRAGLLGTESYDDHDNPQGWAANNTAIDDIVQRRAELVNSYVRAPIKGTVPFLDLTKQIGLARRPVDVEVDLVKRPIFRLTVHKDAQPHGPSVALRQASATENIPIDPKVERATADDHKAADAVGDLAKRGISTYFLQKAFSTGSFGLATERRLVPTRWSITAVDDIVGKQQLAGIRDLPVGGCEAYFGGHLGNYYLILCFADVFRYGLCEMHVSSKQMWTDYEGHEGRTTYAKETAGGYYAARLPIAEHLRTRKRQSSVLAIRLITDEYTTPLGVWVVREATKKALASTPVRCADNASLLAYGLEFLKRTHGVDLTRWIRSSPFFAEVFGQRKLTGY